jgi:hypothetical protein
VQAAAGFDGAYIRLEGNLTLEKIEQGTVVETLNESAICKLEYLGEIPAAVSARIIRQV